MAEKQTGKFTGKSLGTRGVPQNTPCNYVKFKRDTGLEPATFSLASVCRSPCLSSVKAYLTHYNLINFSPNEPGKVVNSWRRFSAEFRAYDFAVTGKFLGTRAVRSLLLGDRVSRPYLTSDSVR